jgi:hypothetical protein
MQISGSLPGDPRARSLPDLSWHSTHMGNYFIVKGSRNWNETVITGHRYATPTERFVKLTTPPPVPYADSYRASVVGLIFMSYLHMHFIANCHY